MISLLAILISATAWNLERRNLVVPKFFDYLPAVCHEIDVDDLSHKEKAYVWCIVYYHFFFAHHLFVMLKSNWTCILLCVFVFLSL